MDKANNEDDEGYRTFCPQWHTAFQYQMLKKCQLKLGPLVDLSLHIKITWSNAIPLGTASRVQKKIEHLEVLERRSSIMPAKSLLTIPKGIQQN